MQGKYVDFVLYCKNTEKNYIKSENAISVISLKVYVFYSDDHQTVYVISVRNPGPLSEG